MNADPGILVQLFDFIRTGHGTMAAGLVLTLLVAGLRHGVLAQFSWSKAWATSKLGGYVLGFGTSCAAYVGTALLAGQGLDVQLVLNGLGAGWVAAGGWEHLQDVLSWLKPPTVGTKPATVSLVLAVLLALTLATGCTKNTRTETLQVTQIGLNAARDGFDAWNVQHEMQIADDPAYKDAAAVHQALADYRAKRKKIIDGLTLTYQLLSTATVQNDAPSLKALLDEATVLYGDIKTIEGDLKGGK